jgi:hypothetical protein
MWPGRLTRFSARTSVARLAVQPAIGAGAARPRPPRARLPRRWCRAAGALSVLVPSEHLEDVDHGRCIHPEARVCARCREAAAGGCFEPRCLQPKGSQLAIRCALLSARCGDGADGGKDLPGRHGRSLTFGRGHTASGGLRPSCALAQIGSISVCHVGGLPRRASLSSSRGGFAPPRLRPGLGGVDGPS